MPFPFAALGADLGLQSGLKVNRTIVAAQTTPSSIKTTDGTFYGFSAMVSGAMATPSAIQYFTSASSTIGVTAPTLEFMIPASVSIASGGTNNGLQFFTPIGIPFVGGINIAGSYAPSTGPNVNANTLIVYTLFA